MLLTPGGTDHRSIPRFHSSGNYRSVKGKGVLHIRNTPKKNIEKVHYKKGTNKFKEKTKFYRTETRIFHDEFFQDEILIVKLISLPFPKISYGS